MDWVAACLNLIAMWVMGNRPKRGMWLLAATSISWITWGMINGIWSIVSINVVLLVLNLRAIKNWETRHGARNKT